MKMENPKPRGTGSKVHTRTSCRCLTVVDILRRAQESILRSFHDFTISLFFHRNLKTLCKI